MTADSLGYFTEHFDRTSSVAPFPHVTQIKFVHVTIQTDFKIRYQGLKKETAFPIKVNSDISDATLDYFLVNNPKLGRFYLLPKIPKKLHNVPDRPVKSNSSYFTENISSFRGFHLKSLAHPIFKIQTNF